MLRSASILLFVSCCSVAFGQIDSNSVTVSASTSATLQPDQAVFGITVQSPLTTGFDDVLAALQGSGITAANFSGVGTQGQIVFSGGQVPPPNLPTLAWTFTLPVPLTNTKAIVASLTTLQQTIAMQKNGLTLSFNIVGTQVSQQLAQSQTCSLPGLIATATTQAKSLAAAANLTVGRILALSSAAASGVYGASEYVGSVAGTFSTISATPAPCTVTVKFALTGY
jgi:hypothetical protein